METDEDFDNEYQDENEYQVDWLGSQEDLDFYFGVEEIETE